MLRRPDRLRINPQPDIRNAPRRVQCLATRFSGFPVPACEFTRRGRRCYKGLFPIITNPFIPLFFAAVAGVLWDQDPSRAWVILIGLAPLLPRLLARRRPIPRTPLDLPMLLFLVSAAIGIWTSYDPRGVYAASPWMPPASQWITGLILAALIFYAMASFDKRDRLAWAMLLFAGLGAVGTFWFALTNDWAANLARLPLIGGLGAALQGRAWPRLPIPELSANLAGGLLAILLFYSLGVAVLGFRSADRLRRRLWGLGGAVAAAVIALGLFLTASRGAWLAAAGGAGLAAIWVLAAWLARRVGWSRGRRLAFAAVMVAVLLMAWLAVTVQWVASPAFDTDGSVAGRAALYSESLVLARDYLFTGAGPGTFPVIHSTYALLIHVPAMIHAHNIYLHILVEQGLLGLIALLAMLLIPAILGLRALISSRTIDPLLLAALAALVAEILHGLVDYPLHGGRSLLFLWVPSAFLLASLHLLTHLCRMSLAASPPPPLSPSPSPPHPLVAGALVSLALLAAVLLWRPAAAAWNANLGALAQTRAELQRYDYRHFGDPTLHQVRRAVNLSAADRYFRRALGYDPTNPTALTRLAAIALDRGDYAAASALVNTAWNAGYRDRVTRLLYGDALVAAGDVDAAVETVRGLSHAAERFWGQAWSYDQDGDQQRAGYAGAAAQGVK